VFAAFVSSGPKKAASISFGWKRNYSSSPFIASSFQERRWGRPVSSLYTPCLQWPWPGFCPPGPPLYDRLSLSEQRDFSTALCNAAVSISHNLTNSSKSPSRWHLPYSTPFISLACHGSYPFPPRRSSCARSWASPSSSGWPNSSAGYRLYIQSLWLGAVCIEGSS
jgi:hypothetical protein